MRSLRSLSVFVLLAVVSAFSSVPEESPSPSPSPSPAPSPSPSPPPVVDLFFGTGGSNTANVLLLNDGNGGFEGEEMPGTYETRSFARSDFNGDGTPDLLLGNRYDYNNAPNQLLLGNGDGGFDDPIDLNGTEKLSTCGVAVGDVDGDGIDDLVFANGNGCQGYGTKQESSIMYGKRKGGTSFEAPVALPGGEMDGTSAVVGDVTGDGMNDIVLGSLSAGTKLLKNNGDRTFDIVLLTPDEGSDKKSVNAMGLHDMNGDGHLDLVLACNYQSNVLLLNPGDGNFTTPVELPEGESTSWSDLAIGDMDGDGAPDVVFCGNYDNLVLWNKPDAHDGDDFFDYYQVVGPRTDGAVALGDVYGSGYLDIVLGGNGMNPESNVVENRGNRGFGRVFKLDQLKYTKVNDVMLL